MTISLTTATLGGSASGIHGAVSAGHRLAATTALDIMRAGGNAVDAAIAASAVQTVVEFPWCGLGGDVFMMVHRHGEPGAVINGSGIAPRSAGDVMTTARVPRFGPKAVAVPGAAGTWADAAKRFGTIPLDDLLSTAAMFAREGFTLDTRHEDSLARLGQELDPTWELAALLAGNGARAGELFVQPELANSLAQIGTEGPEVLYGGELGARISEYVCRNGGALTQDDLRTFEPEWVPPLAMPYRGYTVLQHPPVSLGIIMLIELGLLAGFDPRALAADPVDLIDVMVRCKHVAFGATQGLIHDPELMALDADALLAPDNLRRLRAELPHALDAGASDEGAGGTDTTSLTVADADGWTVTVIHSLFNEFGSRVLVPGTGILLNDRLANLTVDDGPASLRPGTRPVHTLNAYQVLDGDRCVLAGATPGGRGQVQSNFQVLVNHLDLGMSLQAAIDAPRWVNGTPRAVQDHVLHLEHTLPADVAPRLRERGHDVVRSEPREDDHFGSCTVVARHSSGELEAASDARRGAVSAAW